MKINKSVRRLYEELYAPRERLSARVKQAFEGEKRPQWFYLSRIKTLESFALKLETGRVGDPRCMEDFFACTLVVENRTSIGQALNLVNDICDIVERRPTDDGKTHKAPDEFPFDDLRLIVHLKSSDLLPQSPLDEIFFEVQIKTFLQHAWGIATHDLVYKGGSVDWGRARVAFQIKAMLEHAEVSIERVDYMANSSLLAVCDEKTMRTKKIIEWLQATWEKADLPEDLVRLADNILSISKALKLEIDEIFICVQRDTQAGQGALLWDLPPYAVIVRSLYNNHRKEVEAYLRSSSGRFRLFWSDDPEMDNCVKQARPEKIVYLCDSSFSTMSKKS